MPVDGDVRRDPFLAEELEPPPWFLFYRAFAGSQHQQPGRWVQRRWRRQERLSALPWEFGLHSAGIL